MESLAQPSKRPLHIAMLARVTVRHSTGGMELHAETLRRGLVARGHRVTTISTQLPSGPAVIEDEYGTTYYVGQGKPGQYSREWWQASVQTLAQIHAADPVDVVASQSKAAFAYLNARRRLPVAERIPAVIILHNTILGETQAMAGLLLRRPHAVARWLPGGVKGFLEDRRMLPRADAVTALTEESGAALRRWFPIDPKRLTVIPNGVDLVALAAGASQRDAICQRLGIGGDSKRIVLQVARLVSDKGQHFLLEALARPEMQPYRQNIRVVLAGDGIARGKLEAQTRALGLTDTVTFVGRVPSDQVPGLLAAADIFVLPSTSEGMPLSLLEAMACGRPVIASDIPAMACFVQDGDTGRLVPPAQPAALARALAEMLTDRQFAAELGARAAAYIAAHHDQRAMIDDYERVMLRIADPAERMPREGAGTIRTARDTTGA